MENASSSINAFIQELNRPFFFTQKTYRAAMRDDRFILDNYKKGKVEERTLILFLIKSILYPPLRFLIPDILFCTQEDSITDKVFLVCSKYPGKYKKTLLNLLAHMWLTQSQLHRLNHMVDTPEAFCKLFVIYAENDLMAERDFASFLVANKKHLDKVDFGRLISANNVHIPTEKIDVINQISASHRE